MQLPSLRVENLTLNANYYKQVFSNAILLCQNQRFIAQGVTCFVTDSKIMSDAIKSMFDNRENYYFNISKLCFYDKIIIDELQFVSLLGPNVIISMNDTVYEALEYIMNFGSKKYSLKRMIDSFELENIKIRDLGNKKNRFYVLCKVIYGTKIILVDFSSPALRECSRYFGTIFINVVEKQDRDSVSMVDSVVSVNDGIFETEVGDDRVMRMLKHSNGNIVDIFINIVLEDGDFHTLFSKDPSISDQNILIYDESKNMYVKREQKLLEDKRKAESFENFDAKGYNRIEMDNIENKSDDEISTETTFTPINKYVLANKINDSKALFNSEDLVYEKTKNENNYFDENERNFCKKGKDYYPMRRFLLIENYKFSIKHVKLLTFRNINKQRRKYGRLLLITTVIYVFVSLLFPIYSNRYFSEIDFLMNDRKNATCFDDIKIIRYKICRLINEKTKYILSFLIKNALFNQTDKSCTIPFNYRIHSITLNTISALLAIHIVSTDISICRGNVNILFSAASLFLSFIMTAIFVFVTPILITSQLIGFEVPISLLILSAFYGTTIFTMRYFSYKFLRSRLYSLISLSLILIVGIKGCELGDFLYYTQRINPVILTSNFTGIVNNSKLVYFGYCMRLCFLFMLLCIFHISKN